MRQKSPLLAWLVLLAAGACAGCETGKAHPGTVLSVPRSLMLNADVAHLKTYDSPSVEQCLQECCTKRFGACSVASFRRNASEKNCFHFNCQPLNKCKFLPAPSIDSFSFSSDHQVPSTAVVKSNQTSNDHEMPKNGATHSSNVDSLTEKQISPATNVFRNITQEITHFSQEQFAAKDDNATVKPRKGVDELQSHISLDASGVKPRKGVSFKDMLNTNLFPAIENKSNVKPRKGVELESSISGDQNSMSIPTEHPVPKHLSTENISAYGDMMSILAQVFGDDPESNFTESLTESVLTSRTLEISSSQSTPTMNYPPMSKTAHPVLDKTSTIPLFESTTSTLGPSSTENPHPAEQLQSTSTMAEFSSLIKPSTVSYILYSSHDVGQQSDSTLEKERYELATQIQSTSEKPAHVAKDIALNQDSSVVSTLSPLEEESNRKYTSSVHLILSLSFGLLVLVAVLGVVAKRLYDGWQRRDYYRMNYLIDGIYNTYE